MALFRLVSVIDGFEWFWIESLLKNIQLTLEFLKVPVLVLLYIKYFLDAVICNIALEADDTTVYCNCDQASDFWQQLELAAKHESDLCGTVYWGRKWVVPFSAGTTQLESFDPSYNNGAIDVKMDGSVFEEKLSFKILGVVFLLQVGLELLQYFCCSICFKENYSLDSSYEISFFRSCSLSL